MVTSQWYHKCDNLTVTQQWYHSVIPSENMRSCDITAQTITVIFWAVISHMWYHMVRSLWYACLWYHTCDITVMSPWGYRFSSLWYHLWYHGDITVISHCWLGCWAVMSYHKQTNKCMMSEKPGFDEIFIHHFCLVLISNS